MNKKYILKLDNTEIGVYSRGAELFSYKVNGEEFMWEANPEFWGASSPVLFPFVGTVKNQKYSYEGKEYDITTRHGFARTEEFELTERTENTLKFKFSSNEETLKKYPFKFDLYITYTIDKDILEVKYNVVNRTSGEMYFSIGAHPAFALKINDGISLDDYYLELETCEQVKRIPLNENGLAMKKDDADYFLNGENRIDINDNVFNEDAIIFENIKSKKVAIKCRKNSKILEMDFEGFPFIAFWSKPKAPFVCLEPWYGITDFENATGNLKDKKGIEKLDINNEFTAKFKIKAGIESR